MNRFLIPCLLLLSPLYAQEKIAATDENDSPVQSDLQTNQKDFLNLSEEDRTKFTEHLSEASRLFQQKRIFECLDEISDAEAIFSQSAELLNLRGSCYVEMRAFDKAMVALSEALKISPNNDSIQFNIGEVYFVTKEWQKAHDIFKEILPKIPTNNISLSRFVEFKIFLCKLKLNQNDEITILAQKYDFLDDSPYHYFAQATLAYEKKNIVEAEEWLGRASRIFQDPRIIAPWRDTFVEFGYIDGFYGGEEAATTKN